MSARAELRARLEARTAEIQAAISTRVAAIADPAATADPAYIEGLRRAVAAAIDYGIAAVEASESREPPVPIELLAQARLAARNSIPLDTVLRRYFAGYSLLGFYLIEEAGRDGLMGGTALQRLTVDQASHFDRLLAAIGEEHARESTRPPDGLERRRAERVRRMLAGEQSDIGYELDGHHLGIVAAGDGDAPRLRELARSTGCRLLVVSPDAGVIWAWLGSRDRPILEDLLGRLCERPADDAVGLAREGEAVALGEPAEGLAGWRLTHRQAKAVLPIALREAAAPVRYADAGLVAAILQDDLVATSLRELFLVPLEATRGGGRMARATLRAYFACDRTASSAAALLGVDRRTVTNRLRSIESVIGRPLSSCAAELEVALRLEQTTAG